MNKPFNVSNLSYQTHSGKCLYPSQTDQPIMSGLVLAPLVSWATGLPGLGRWLWRMNVFRIPEEQDEASGPQPAADPQPLLQAAE